VATATTTATSSQPSVVLVAGIWMVKQGPPVAERVTPMAEDHVTV